MKKMTKAEIREFNSKVEYNEEICITPVISNNPQNINEIIDDKAFEKMLNMED